MKSLLAFLLLFFSLTTAKTKASNAVASQSIISTNQFFTDSDHQYACADASIDNTEEAHLCFFIEFDEEDDFSENHDSTDGICLASVYSTNFSLTNIQSRILRIRYSQVINRRALFILFGVWRL